MHTLQHRWVPPVPGGTGGTLNLVGNHHWDRGHPPQANASYNANNQITGGLIQYDPSGAGNVINDGKNNYLYDGEGRICAADGTVHYTYDALDRLTTKATPEGTLSYTFYPTGKVQTIQSSNTNGISVAYTYDDLNRLSSVVDDSLPAAANTTNYTYDAASNLVNVAYPNGFTSTLTYDQLNRLTELSSAANSAQIADYKYTLGLTGIRTNATEITPTSSTSGRTIQWSYDNIYRLNNESITGDPNNINGSVNYTLDPVGNRLSDSSSITGLNPIAGTYNPNDQLSGETYDQNGNTTFTGGKSFTYDSENHLTKMTENGTVVTLVYDAFGNRVSKTVTTASETITTQYLVEDDVNPTGYPQVVEEVIGGVAARTYTYGLQRINEDQPISGTWTTSFYGYDGGGSVRQLTNSAGVVTDTYDYDAFGNLIHQTGSTPNNYLYRGEQYDSDLALYYLRARYYNPATGRFMSRDPEDGVPTDPATLHKYDYADGDPVDGTDPSGRNAVMEYTEVTVKIDIGALPAVAALGCAVSVAYNVIALNVITARDITPTLNCKAKGKGRMRVQLQLGLGNGKSITAWGKADTNDDPPGVTLSQVGGLLSQLWGAANSGAAGVFPKTETWDLYNAIIKVSLCAGSKIPGGTMGLDRSVCSENVGRSGWRVDLDNLYGWNLTQ